MESLQMAFGCSRLACTAQAVGSGDLVLAGMRRPRIYQHLLGRLCRKLLLWWGLSGPAGRCSPCRDLRGAGAVVQPGAETAPGAVPVWAGGAFAILWCLPQVTAQNLVLILSEWRHSQ